MFHDLDEKFKTILQMHLEGTWPEFRTLCQDNEIDPVAVYKELGGDPDDVDGL